MSSSAMGRWFSEEVIFNTSRRCRQDIVAVYPLVVNNNQLWVSLLGWQVGSHIRESGQHSWCKFLQVKRAVLQSTWRLLVKKIIHSVNTKIFAQTKTCQCKMICHTSSYFGREIEQEFRDLQAYAFFRETDLLKNYYWIWPMLLAFTLNGAYVSKASFM